MTYSDAVKLKPGDHVKPKKWKDLDYVGTVKRLDINSFSSWVSNNYCYVELTDGGRYYYKDLIKI